MIPAGRLIHPIVILQPTVNQRPGGQNKPTYTPFHTTWGEIKGLAGRNIQQQQANTIATTVTHQIRMRFVAGVKPGYRVQYTADNVPAQDESGEFYETLAAADYGSFTSAQYLALDCLSDATNTITVVTTYQIISIVNTDERNMELVLLCTEVLG